MSFKNPETFETQLNRALSERFRGDEADDKTREVMLILRQIMDEIRWVSNSPVDTEDLGTLHSFYQRRERRMMQNDDDVTAQINTKIICKAIEQVCLKADIGVHTLQHNADHDKAASLLDSEMQSTIVDYSRFQESVKGGSNRSLFDEEIDREQPRTSKAILRAAAERQRAFRPRAKRGVRVEITDELRAKYEGKNPQGATATESEFGLTNPEPIATETARPIAEIKSDYEAAWQAIEKLCSQVARYPLVTLTNTDSGYAVGFRYEGAKFDALIASARDTAASFREMGELTEKQMAEVNTQFDRLEQLHAERDTARAQSQPVAR